MRLANEAIGVLNAKTRMGLSVFLAGMILMGGQAFGGAKEEPSKVPDPVSVNATLVSLDGKVLPFDGSCYAIQRQGKLTQKTGGLISKGKLSMTLAPGTYELEVLGLEQLGYYLKSPVFEIKSGEANPALTFTAAKLVSLEVLVRDAVTQKPIQGAGIMAQFPEKGANAVSDESGKVHLSVIPGVVRIRGGDRKHVPALQDLNVGTEGATVTLDLAPYLVLTGNVLAANGKPVTGVWAEVWVRWDGHPEPTHSVEVKDAAFTDAAVPKGPCIVVVGAAGMAPRVEPLVVSGDTERTFTLEEGVEVTFKATLDAKVLAKGIAGRPSSLPRVIVLDANTGAPVFSFPTAKADPGKEITPVAESKTRLMPGKYKIVCTYEGRFFAVEEMDLKEPRTITVEVKDIDVFALDGAGLLKDIRFPEKP
jgi:hypothetical protein